MDVVGDLLSSMRLSGGVIIDAGLQGEWSLISEVTADDWAPYFPVTGAIISYHFVRSGELWAEVDGMPPRKVGPGGIMLFPQNRRHRLFNADVETVLARDVITPPSSSEPVQVRIAGEGETTELYCGFLTATGHNHPLLDMLPPMMIVDPGDERRSEWIASSLRFAAEELRSMPPLFLGRVAELMFADAVRAFVESEGASAPWLNGLRDPGVAKALTIIHRDFAKELDVESLARQSGLSRTVLGERFVALLGEPPMRYLGRIRMERAATLLREGRQTAASIGYAIGFNSEVAFSRAFKREYGEPPAAWAKRVSMETSGAIASQPADRIERCRSSDGAEIAYAISGSGLPLVKAPNWMTHLELDRSSPVYGHWIADGERGRTLLRSDMRGFGMSDWDPPELSLERMVDDLAAVVDHAGLDPFDLLGISHGGAVAIAYAAQFPDRVRRLVLVNSFAAGWAVRADADEIAWRRSLMQINRKDWGRRRNTLGELFFLLYFPVAGREIADWYSERLEQLSTLKNLERMLEVSAKLDVRDQLAQIQAPTIVFHARQCANVPVAEGRAVAAAIPNARFVELDSANEVPLDDEEAWRQYLALSRAFLTGKSR